MEFTGDRLKSEKGRERGERKWRKEGKGRQEHGRDGKFGEIATKSVPMPPFY